MLNRNDKKEIAGKLKALFPKASDSGREQLLNLLVNCCCIDLCSLNNNADDIQFTGLTLLGNTLSLTLTINGTPTTQVVNLPTQISTTLVNNGDGTFTYTNESNVVTTIDVATLLVDAGISDGFVNNNDGTLTHTSINNTSVTFDINNLLLTTTPLFTVNAGTTSVSTDASLGSQVITYGDILHFWSNGSLNFNVQAGSVVVGIDTEADIIPYVPTTLTSTNVGDALDELAANSHNPTTLTNTAAPFSWNVSTQTGNIPLTPTLVDNGDGTITYNPNNGAAPITIDVTENANEVLTTTSITVNGTTYPANTSVQTILSAISAYAGITNLTYTPSATNGTIVSDTGSDATIPQATITDAGLLIPADKIKLNNLSGVNTGDQTSIVGITGTKAQFNTAVTDGDFLYVGDITQYTDELAQDAIGAMIDTSLVYVDGTPLLTRAALIGDITATQGSNSTLIANNVVTNAKLAQASSFTLKGNNTGAVANVTDLSIADVKTLLAYTGADVANTPAGNIAATTVQAAINELDGEKQVNLQFQEEGVNLGTSGTVDTVNFTGAAVTSSRVGNTLTVDIPATIGVTNLSYTPSATNGIVVSDTGTDATITSVTGVNAGLATPTMLANSHVPTTFNDSGTIDFTVSGTDNQTITATLLGISGATIGQIPQSDGAGNITWVTPTSSTNLTYTASPTQGTVLSDTGTDAIIPSVTVTDAGLATPSLLTNSHVPVTTLAGTVTITQSGTDNQTLKADITGIATATVGQIPSTDGAGNVVWTTPTSSTADNGLTETLGNIQLGGTLLHDTTVTQGSNKLVFERFALELTNTTKSILGLTDVNFVGEYTEDATNFGSGVTAYFFNGILSDGSGNTAVVIGKETVGGTYTRTTQILAGNEVMTISTDGNVTTTVEISTNTGFLTNVSDISGSATSIEHSTNRWMASIVGTGYQHSVQLLPQGLLYSNGNLPSSYLFPTADGANGEVMMTNGSGVVSFEPTTNIVANEWHTTGNAGTDGGATNFVGTTDAQDLVIKTNSTEIARFGQQGNAAIGSDLTGIDPSLIPPTANNIGSMAFQSGQAIGLLSTAFSLSTALGPGSMAWGEANIAEDNVSTVWGRLNRTEGRLSTSWGESNLASGTRSTVFGQGNVSSGQNTVAFGQGNTAPSYAETTIGSATTLYTPIDAIAYNAADRLFTIGNGVNTANRNNALTLWKDGRSMWNGDVAKQNTWIGVNGTNAQNFINVTTPAGNLAAISTEHTTSGNYAVLGSNNGNSGLVINNTKQFAFTTTAGTTSTQLGATSTVANYSNTGFLFGGGGVATSTVDISGTLGLSNTRINTANPVLSLNNTVYHFTGGASGTVNMTVMTVDNRTFILTNYSGVSLTLSNSVRIGSAATTTSLPDNTSMTIAYDGAEFFRIA